MGLSAGEVARALWAAMEARAWDEVARRLHDRFTCEWPQSGEHFDKAGYLRVNREYPGDWHIAVREVIDAGERAVTEVEVALGGEVHRAVSLFRVTGGQVIELREFWPEPFAIPEWRAGWSEPAEPA